MSLIRLIPNWVWFLVAAFLVIFGITKWVESYFELKEQVVRLKEDNDSLVQTNSKIAEDNRILRLDVKEKVAINQNIAKENEKSNVDFADLDTKLQAAIVERDALEAAVNATEAIASTNTPPVTQPIEQATAEPTAPPEVKPAVVKRPGAVKPPPKPVEIDILWEAYCLEGSSAKCEKAK